MPARSGKPVAGYFLCHYPGAGFAPSSLTNRKVPHMKSTPDQAELVVRMPRHLADQLGRMAEAEYCSRGAMLRKLIAKAAAKEATA